MVIWSIPAKHDLKKIHDYIAEDSKYYALKVSQEFISKSEALFEFPKMGRGCCWVSLTFNPTYSTAMTKQRRIEFEGAYYHILSRGNESGGLG